MILVQGSLGVIASNRCRGLGRAPEVKRWDTRTDGCIVQGCVLIKIRHGWVRRGAGVHKMARKGAGAEVEFVESVCEGGFHLNMGALCPLRAWLPSLLNPFLALVTPCISVACPHPFFGIGAHACQS